MTLPVEAVKLLLVGVILCVAVAAICQLGVKSNLRDVVLGDQFGHSNSQSVR